MKFHVKDFFSKCDQIRNFLWIWSHLLKKSLMENFMFCTVNHVVFPAFLSHICSYLTSVCVFVCEKFLIDAFLDSLCSGYHYRKVSMNKVRTYLLWSFQIMLVVCQAFAIVKTLVNNYRYLIIRHNALSTAQKMKFSIKYFFSKCDQICRKLDFLSSILPSISRKHLHHPLTVV